MLEQIAYGINTQLSDKWNLTAEAVTNRASGLPDGAQKMVGGLDLLMVI